MKPARIIVVEDDRVVARDIKAQLERMGHVVLETTTRGADAVTMSVTLKPDLVLMDIRLDAGLDGIEAARAVLAGCEAAVIFLTAYADADTLQRANDSGAFGYLLKPFDQAQLRASIEMVLHREAVEADPNVSGSRIRDLTTIASDWYWEQDKASRFSYLSDAAQDGFGGTAVGAFGRALWEIAGVAPVSGSWAEHRAAVASRVPFREFEYAYVAADGRTRHVSVSGAPKFDDRGSFNGYRGVGRDVTDRRRNAPRSQSVVGGDGVAAPSDWRELRVLHRDRDLVLSRGVAGQPASSWLRLAATYDPPAPRTLERLRHEYALRDLLDPAWAARPSTLNLRAGRASLMLQDPGGIPLCELLDRMQQPEDFLRVAPGIAAALGKVHDLGLIHKDVKPEHVLVDEATGRAWLTGFGIASPIRRERQTPEPSEAIAGTLAYISPEQTGRMNRSLDARGDLYALGVTFYRMLAGRLPFEASDAMEWIHCHIARPPAPLRVAELPRLGALPAIVMKLLAKTAEERYQSAAGVEADLRRCEREWTELGAISDFVPGERDGSDRLLVPEKLYGRDDEIDVLVKAFDAVVESGRPGIVFVSGYSGIGKSSVVNELHKSLVPPRGLFAAGKFDQYKRDIPYATIAQAFQGLVRQILAKSDEEMASWRRALRSALGANAQLLINLIPELEAIVGEQPPVPDLPASEATARFQSTFRAFLGVFARPEHPLALFLDDLQWLDAATITLFEHLATSDEVRHVLIVGAYRDNEIGPHHPFARSLQTIRSSGAHVRELSLAPLAPQDITELVADALRTEHVDAAPLADLVHEKSGGNAFFALQFFGDLADRMLLRFDPMEWRWTWDIDAIRARASTDNVIELLLRKLSRLPTETREVLVAMSCLGNTAPLETLVTVKGCNASSVSGALWPALGSGLVVRVADGYAFLHDRVQEAAYALLPQADRPAEHLRIGRALLASAPPDAIAERAYEIASQFDRAIGLITAPEERLEIARLNAIAGKRAISSTAFVSAQSYFAAGCELLNADGWTLAPTLRFDLERDLAECEFLTGDLPAADSRLTALAPRAHTPAARASLTWLRVTLYTAMDECPHAVDVAREHLAGLGIHWSSHPTAEEVRAEYESLLSLVGQRPIDALVDLPVMRNPDMAATVDVLMALLPPAVYTDRNLVLLVLCRTANISIENGNTDASAVGYAYLGMYLGPTFNDYPWAYSFSRLGLELVEKRGLDRFKARVYMTLGYHVAPWTKPLDPGTFDLLERTTVAANEVGDVNYAGYYWYCLVSSHLVRGTPLAEVQRIAEAGLAFVTKTNFRLLITILTAQLMLVRTLRGATPVPGRLDDDGFSESVYEAEFAQSRGLFIAGMMYWVRKLQARFLARDYEGACAAAARAEPDIDTLYGHLELADFHFYAALARAAHFDGGTPEERQRSLRSISASQAQLDVWARCCPENWAARASLVAAESARLGGRDMEAMRMYEQSVQLARLHGFVSDEAIAHEAAARFYAALGFGSFTEDHLRRGRDAFMRWGAHVKERDLDDAFPAFASVSTEERGATSLTRLHELDLANVVKSSQAVSAETDHARLMQTLMTTVLQQAGAERGLLIAVRGDDLRIEAHARTTREGVEVVVADEVPSPQKLPESVLRYVVRARDSVLLYDALAPNPYASDAYIARHRSRSILCLPLLKQAILIGVVYLENSLAPGVFTPTRLSVLKLLASQAAISLQNARLYAELHRENSERRLSEAALRRSEERYALAVRAAGDGHTDWIVASDEFNASPRLLEMCGLAAGERFRGRADWTERFPLHPEDRARVIAAIQDHFDSDLDRLKIDLRVLRGGEIRWMHATLLCLRDASGVLQRASTAFTDITDRLQAEDALRTAQSELTRVSRLTTVGHLAVSIAHEINQPLAAIVTNAGAGINFLNRRSPSVADAQDVFDQILYDGKRAADVIRSLVSLSRKTGPKLGPVDMHGAAREVIALLQTELDRNLITLTTDFAADSAVVEADRIQVQQVLINLVVNSIEAIVAADTVDRAVILSTRSTPRGTMVSVADTGPGLDAQALPRIFEPFFTTKESGTGMGLSICRSIIEGHGSQLNLKSTGARGALFEFELFAPLAER